MYSQTLLAELAQSIRAELERPTTVDVQLTSVPSAALSTEIPVAVLLPPDIESLTELPIMICLDGGVGDRMSLVGRKALYDDMFCAGLLPPMIVASFSGGANQFYTGGWEQWVVSEFPDWLCSQFADHVPADPHRRQLLLTGMSAGGHGALKVAFKHPQTFVAVAALEPAIIATLEWPEQHTRASWWMFEASARAVYGEPFPENFLQDHPPMIAMANGEQINSSGLEIYFEAGDEDMVMVHDGAEFLHRVLWDLDIAHEYHLVRWADHGGPHLNDRIIESHAFLAAVLAGGKRVRRDLPLSEAEQAFVAYVHSGGPASGKAPPEHASQGDSDGERALSVMAAIYEPMKAFAAQKDADMARRFGRLPGTDAG